MQFVLDVIKEMTPSFVALSVVVLGAFVLPLMVWMSVKPNRLSHEEKKWEHERQMVGGQAKHAEEMRRIDRDVPRLVNGKPAKVVEHHREED